MANWEHHKMTIDELKTLVRDVYDLKIFTSFQAHRANLMMVFMPLMGLGSPPQKPSFENKIRVDRKNKLQYLEDKMQYDRETPERIKYIDDVGMLYEEYSNAGPRGINGQPIFFSMHIVSREDATKFIEMYNEYVKVREDFEKEWGVKS